MAKKYIDADRLKAEIERRNLTNYCGTAEQYEEELFAIIDSLQQEQPCEDFEKEWDEFEDWTESYITSDYPTYYGPKQIARHFYELGKQSKEPVSEDLEKEIKTWIPAHIVGGDEAPWKELKDVVIQWAEIVARHFYILGLKNNIPVTQITLGELAKEGEPVSKDLKEEYKDKDWGILRDMSIGEYDED